VLAVGVGCDKNVEVRKIGKEIIDAVLESTAFAKIDRMSQQMHAVEVLQLREYFAGRAAVVDDNDGPEAVLQQRCYQRNETAIGIPCGNQHGSASERLRQGRGVRFGGGQRHGGHGRSSGSRQEWGHACGGGHQTT
jgi:hypothetical protein